MFKEVDIEKWLSENHPSWKKMNSIELLFLMRKDFKEGKFKKLKVATWGEKGIKIGDTYFSKVIIKK
ncbi:MAG TPA: hypothetical protein ENG63_06905 [Candidatus Desulfofervidus auxilii]|uniref:Uncharacterized protein n=1 Tax=Desulfofervidus auxilii TaxID=1621989 RepID=A0A7C0Y630_DESA2|nr:hypothetical protein [Candidatus Desulfofervidus auxilii]